MATGYLHSKFEATPGNEVNTPTLSTKEIYLPIRTFGPQLGAAHLDRNDELRGVDEPIQYLSESYSPSWEMDVRAYPDVLGFVVTSMLGAPTTTTGNGVITDPDGSVIPTGCYRHVWTAPYGPSGNAPQTCQFQAAYTDQSVYYKLKGAATSELSITSPEEGGVGLSASGPALHIDDVSSPGLTPSYESLTIPPFERSHLTIQTFLSGTGTTEDFTVSVANPVEAVRTLSTASKYPDTMEKGDGPIIVSGSIPKRALDVDDWNALVAATTFVIKARWQSTSVIASSYVYSLWLECNNAQYTGGGPEALANKRTHGAEFDWQATYGGTAGSSKFTLVNATTSYSTTT